MRRPIRCAIIGCGRMGRERAKGIAAAGGRITAFVDVDRERAAGLGDGYAHPTILESHHDLAWDDVDCVFVCTPPAFRMDFARAAVRSGAAVFFEKPLATNADEAAPIVDIVNRSGVVNAVGYMNRYRRSIQYAREVLHNDLVGIACYWAGTCYNVPWWRLRRISGGPVNEQAIHLLDLCRYIGGEIRNVHAFAQSNGETASALFEFESGPLATLLYTCKAREKSIALHAISSRGVLRLEGWNFRLEQDTINARAAIRDIDPFENEVSAFIHAVATGDRSAIRCDVSDAYRTQVIMDRLLLSAAEEHALSGA